MYLQCPLVFPILCNILLLCLVATFPIKKSRYKNVHFWYLSIHITVIIQTKFYAILVYFCNWFISIQAYSLFFSPRFLVFLFILSFRVFFLFKLTCSFSPGFFSLTYSFSPCFFLFKLTCSFSPSCFFIFKLTCSFSPCFFLFKLTYSFSIQTNPPFLSAWLISLSILILSFISLVYLYSSIHCFSQLTDISIKVYLLFLSPVYFYLSLPTFSLSLVYYYIYLPTFSLPSVYFYLNCPIYSIQGSLLFLNLNLFLYQALIFILSYSSV